MIVAQDLSKRFGKVVAVDSINFRIPPGRVVGFLGPNGAGKTTTIRMIAGFLTPTSGTVKVDSVDVRSHPLLVRRTIGYLPESTPLYTEMRVTEFLMFRARLFGIERSQRASAVGKVLERCWLRKVRRRPIGHLSKGYRQRVGLAAALLHEPRVMILDEPMVGLDPSQILEVRRLIRELAGDRTILLSTHILSEVEVVCDEVIVIAGGRVQTKGTLEELRADAARHCRYIVEADSAAAEPAVRGLPGIRHVQILDLEDGWQRMTIEPDANAKGLGEAIGRSLAQGGVAVRELKIVSPTLEQMFVSLTGTDEDRAKVDAAAQVIAPTGGQATNNGVEKVEESS